MEITFLLIELHILSPTRCDSGARHLSKFHNDGVLAKDYGIHLPEDSMGIDISDLLQS